MIELRGVFDYRSIIVRLSSDPPLIVNCPTVPRLLTQLRPGCPAGGSVRCPRTCMTSDNDHLVGGGGGGGGSVTWNMYMNDSLALLGEVYLCRSLMPIIY